MEQISRGCQAPHILESVGALTVRSWTVSPGLLCSRECTRSANEEQGSGLKTRITKQFVTTPFASRILRVIGEE